jgi:ribA/ribD-fused uncharacterized protein
MTLHFSTHEPISQRLRTYVRSEVVVVHETKKGFGGLSNMASGYPLLINGVEILTSEALYQACRFPHHPELQQEIIAQWSPMAAKMKSKRYRQDSRPDWDEVRFQVMRWCLRVKLAQNYAEFSQLLLATRDRPIVEESRKDDYWGAKFTDKAGSTLIGQNVLGRLLMELRERLKGDEAGALKTVPTPNIPNFLLLGQPIQTVRASDSSAGRSRNVLL